MSKTNLKLALTFPGQGSQSVGMGLALATDYPAAKAVFDEVDDALGQNLSTLMFNGPEDELRLTENAQPALMAVSLAVVRVLAENAKPVDGIARYVAGHSLGEYSALCAAGALGLAPTARLLRVRGRAMQKAVPVGEGAMAAILGLELADVEQIAADAASDAVCEVANDNSPGQVVLSGTVAAIDRAIELAKKKGARRALLLPVSAPFHCSLMATAAEEMAMALSDVPLKPPVVPVVVNVLARPVSDPDEIRQHLVAQVTGRVRWSETISWLTGQGGVTELAELGCGKVLTGLARRIDRSAEAFALTDRASIEAFLA